MNLDCIEGSELREEDSAWVIIDYDNDNKELCSSHSVDHAWFLAAILLQAKLNKVEEVLK